MNAGSGGINVNDANTVGTLGASVTGGGILYKNDNTALTVGTVAASTPTGNFAGATGLSTGTSNTNIDLLTGTGGLTVSNNIAAGTGKVYLTTSGTGAIL